MTYVREDTAARQHPLFLKGLKDADRAVAKMRRDYAKRALKLEARAEKMLEEARELSYLATRYHEYETPYSAKRTEVEDAAYWAARRAIGTFPRDESGDYVVPAPMWNASYQGEFIGQFQGEERCDILRQACPKGDERNWSDFEVELAR